METKNWRNRLTTSQILSLSLSLSLLFDLNAIELAWGARAFIEWTPDKSQRARWISKYQQTGIRGGGEGANNGKSPRLDAQTRRFLFSQDPLFDREHGLSSTQRNENAIRSAWTLPACVGSSVERLLREAGEFSRGWIADGSNRGGGGGEGGRDRFASARRFTPRDSPSRKAEHYCDIKEHRFRASWALRDLHCFTSAWMFNRAASFELVWTQWILNVARSY